MKRNLLFSAVCLFAAFSLKAQVTQINSNNSLEFEYPLSSTKTIYVSRIDSTIWVTDGTLAGTIPLSATIKFVGALGDNAFLNGRLIFSGTTPAFGAELYVTDGTPGGTVLVTDINPGPASSSPDDGAAILNGFVYFTAERPAEGRELWRTNGTLGGTSFVKDVIAGPLGSNTPGNYELTAGPGYLLFAARTPASGIELWRSDGSDAGTVILKDINTGNAGADSSNPRLFYQINNVMLFNATSALEGDEVWRTDGTPNGTTILADINPGPGSSTPASIGLSFFHTFNNRAYFNASNGVSAGQVWGTDGTVANTSLLKDIVPSPLPSLIFLPDAVNVPGKFIFPVADLIGRTELWQSDGTSVGTVLFKSFAPADPSNFPLIFVPYKINNFTIGQELFQGDKFFFMASTAAEGYELWISDGVDGTAAHTHIVADINPGPADGFESTNLSYTYTSSALFFPANDGSSGSEVWQSNGTLAGTTRVADLVTGPTGSDPQLDFFITNGKVIFQANNGDSPTLTDLYAVDGTFSPLPIRLGDFTVLAKSADALLNWRTLEELNTKSFTVQRSYDAIKFENIGSVAAHGSSSVDRSYSFVDAGIMNSGKPVVYYRLQVIDNDTKSTFSTVIALKIKNNGKWNVKLLANPVSADIKLTLSGVTRDVQVSVMDMTGKRVFTNSLPAVNGQLSIASTKLAPGTYLLVAESGGEKKTISFIK